jgi:GxxExxY protein
MRENEIGTIIIKCVIAVHRELGPGLLESVYQVALKHELETRGLPVEQEVAIPVHYKGIQFEQGFRADLIVEGKIIIELKFIEHVTPAHKNQLQTYRKLTGCKLGYLLNFGEALLKAGITRAVDQLEA